MTTPETPDSVTRRGVQEVLRSFASSDWTGMTLEVHGMRITVGKNGPPSGPVGSGEATPPAASAGPVAAAPVQAAPTQAAPVKAAARAESPTRAHAEPETRAAAAPPAVAVDTTGLVEVRSPAVGSFWAAPSPGQAPFVQVGQVVAQHEQLAIVEVMKLMNPVVAPQPGEVVQVLVENAEMVEYDQVLFRIRPTDA